MEKYFYVRMKFQKEGAAEKIMRRFFEEFNPKSCILIKGNEGIAKIYFKENPPIETISVIEKCCKLEYLKYGNTIEQVEEEEKAEQVKEVKKKKSSKKNVTETKSRLNQQKDTYLQKIYLQSVSYEDFVDNLIKDLDLSRYKIAFKAIIEEFECNPKAKMQNIPETLQERGISCSKYINQPLGQKIRKKSSLTLDKLIKGIIKYKDVQFNNSQQRESAVQGMPKIDELAKALDHVTNMQNVEEKIKYILDIMGLRDKNVEQQNAISEIAIISVTKKIYNREEVLEKTTIPEEQRTIMWMHFSTMLNDYIVRHCPTHEKVELKKFLENLSISIL